MDRRSSRILAYLFSFKLIEHSWLMSWCKRQISPTNIYQHLAVTIAFFYISFVLVITLYAIMLIKLRKHTQPGEHSANAEEQRSRRNWNLLKMAFIIVFVLFLCWIPSVSNWTTLHFEPNSSIWFSCNSLLYDNFNYFMAVANCAIKWIMCLIFSSNYRQHLA